MYSFFGLGIGFGVFLLCVSSTISLLYITLGKKYISIFPVCITYLYYIVRKQDYFADQLLFIVAIINVVGFCYGSLNALKINRTIVFISLLNTMLVIIQVILHYSIGFDLSIVNESLLHTGIQAGHLGGGTLFRPSGFFLEPSHFAQYASMSLISLLLIDVDNSKITKALFITAGCLLTTSGIGIFLVMIIWGWYGLLVKKINFFRIIKFTLLATGIIIILLQFSFIDLAIERVFGEVDGYNAIDGRLWAWGPAIGPMDGNILVFGYGTSTFFDGYLTGLMQIIVQFGIVGIVLFTLPFIYISVHSRKTYVVLGSVVYCGLMLVASVSNVYSMVFYTGLVFSWTLIKRYEHSIYDKSINT